MGIIRGLSRHRKSLCVDRKIVFYKMLDFGFDFVFDFLNSKTAGAKLKITEIKQIAGGTWKQRPREINKCQN